jgi:hypothetical protein
MKWVFGCTLLPGPIKANQKHAVILHENVRNAIPNLRGQAQAHKAYLQSFEDTSSWDSARVSGQEVTTRDVFHHGHGYATHFLVAVKLWGHMHRS